MSDPNSNTHRSNTMKAAKIVMLSPWALDPNPYRQMDLFPFSETKIQALVRSLEDVGMWPSLIAREHEGGHQLAFGHHRKEAAIRAELDEIPVIIQRLSDEDMLKYLGRENGEDYGSEFLIMLNTWEAAVSFKEDARLLHGKPIEIAKILGWTTSVSHSGPRKNQIQMTVVARACNDACSLIREGWLKREELADIPVAVARDIVGRVKANFDRMDKSAKKNERPKKELDSAKRHVVRGAKSVIQDVRNKATDTRTLRAQVDKAAFDSARADKKKKIPMFDEFARMAADSINKMIADDKTSERLETIVENLEAMQTDSDHLAVERIQFELEQLGKRTKTWHKKLTPTSKKVVKLIGNE